jgi:hydrogenase-4 component B
VTLALVGSVLSVVGGRDAETRLACAYVAAALCGLLALGVGLAVLAGASVQRVDLLTVLPGNDLAITLSPLSAFFWAVIGLVVLPVSIFGRGYGRHYLHDRAGALMGTAFNLFVLSLLLVTATDNALCFLVVWETMALLSYLLVVYDRHDRSVVNAGLLYALMTRAGTVCILLAFLVLASRAPGQSLDFVALPAGARALGPSGDSVVFLLALAGFGAKAGVMPLHVWLPRAHPVAPSHVSALMSGVMIKTGIYGMVLFWFGFLPAGPLWWGELVLALGVVSALLGVLYALMQHDLKRLLAYHSVENIGIILIGLGAALLLRSDNEPVFAALALAGALFHTLNHAVFKSLLFLCAGAVQHAAHTRDLERMGGLLKRMPWVGLCFLIGSAAISALPPLNGFASEWLVYQSLLAVGIHISTPGVGGGALVAGAGLALTGALAATCFVKAAGIAFLGQPRSTSAGAATDAGVFERVGMIMLAVLCAVLGLLAPLVLRLIAPITVAWLGAKPVGQQSGWVGALRPAGSQSQAALQPIGLALGLVGLTVLGVVLTRALRRGRSGARIGKTWNCGVGLTPRMQYSATSFAQPVQRMFSAIVWPDRVEHVEYTHAPYFVSTMSHEASFKPLFRKYLYAPVHAIFLRIVFMVRLLQNGSIHAYLAYVFVALICTLAVMR